MKRLYRSKTDKKISGLIGGLGAYFEVDSNLLRLLSILICFLSGIIPFIIAYFVAWVIVPEAESESP